MDKEYRQTPFDELEWWFATFKQDKTLASPEETSVIQNTLGKQVIVLDPQNSVKNFKQLTRDPDWGVRLALAYHTVILRPRTRNRTQHQPEGLARDSFFHYVAATLPYMRNVKELILLDPDVDSSAATAKDLFEDGHAAPDAVVRLRSVAREMLGVALQRCRQVARLPGLLRPAPAAAIAGNAAEDPELEVPGDVCSFCVQAAGPLSITHLCIHVEWGGLPLILRKISNLPGLSGQLHSLRLNCYASAEHQPAGGGTTPGPGVPSSPLALRSPLIVCRNLHAPVLNYLEINETTPCDGASANALQNDLGIHNGNGNPSFQRVAWRPAWNESRARQSDKKIKYSVNAIFTEALTINFLAIALDRKDSGPWRVFTRDLRSGRVEEAERRHAINELSWKVTEWEDARGKQWHWPQSSQLYVQESVIS